MLMFLLGFMTSHIQHRPDYPVLCEAQGKG